MKDADVVIVGAGLAGLSCARELVDRGLRPSPFWSMAREVPSSGDR